MSERYITAELRRLVSERARRCCEYCRAQADYSSDPLTVDHIIPFSLGGPTTVENLAFSCHGCNQCKAARIVALDPVSAETAPLFNPRTQRWEEHFAWNEDFSMMIGLTATGGATIAALQLNRFGLVNLRRLLVQAGQHPPPS
ncbi:MAG: HNH endonuclease [Blastocatellia bacterium]